MSFVSRKFYTIKCDRCGNLLDDNEWYDKDGLEASAENEDWITQGRKHYCPDCWEYDDDDNIVIKPTDEIRQ